MFSHFSPPIVLKESEPMRRMLWKFLWSLQWTQWFSCWPDLLEVQDSVVHLVKSLAQDAVMSDGDGAHGRVTLLENQKVYGGEINKSGNIERQIKTVKLESQCQPFYFSSDSYRHSLPWGFHQSDGSLRTPHPLPILNCHTFRSAVTKSAAAPLKSRPVFVLLILVSLCSLQECLEAFPLPNSPRAVFSPVGY